MRFWQDDNGNDSSFRLWWMPFVALLILAFGVMLGLFIREIMAGGDNIRELFQALSLTGGSGVFAFLAKAWQKRYERPKPLPTEEAEPLPTPLPPTTTKEIVIDRFQQNEYATLGRAGIWNGSAYLYNFVTLELPWKDNQRRISCIPEGEYKAVATFRSSNGQYALWLTDVPGRSEIMMHTANWTSEILGCIAPGVRHEGSGAGVHVVFSREAMDKIREYFSPGAELKILIRKT